MSEDAPKPVDSARRVPVGTIVLLVLAAFLYVLMLANLTDSGSTDAAGRGLNEAFAALVGLVLWIVLAILLAIGGVNGHMPLAAGMVAAFLLPVSAVGAVAAADLYDRQGGWPILVPALLPPLIALYAVWVRLPRLHDYLPPVPTGIAMGAAIAALTALPLAAHWEQARPDPMREARRAAEQEARRQEEQQQALQERDREAATFASLGPDSSLGDYLPYLRDGHAREALAGLRLVKSRQADAVALLQRGRLGDLEDLRQFNLDPTPELCQAYGAALGAAAAQVSPRARSDYLSAAIALEGQLPNIRWLAGQHCDLGEPLGLLETNVRAVADSSRMTKFADTLAALRHAR